MGLLRIPITRMVPSPFQRCKAMIFFIFEVFAGLSQVLFLVPFSMCEFKGKSSKLARGPESSSNVSFSLFLKASCCLFSLKKVRLHAFSTCRVPSWRRRHDRRDRGTVMGGDHG